MMHRSMRRSAATGLAAVAAILIGACSSSSSTPSTASSSSAAATGMGTKTLVVESTALTPLTQTFNPFSATSTGYTLHATNLYYEPLFWFNITNPAQPPVPALATAASWSNGGKTLTLTTRSGVKWSDGKPFSAADVAFTFTLLAHNPALAVSGTPAPSSATATGPDTAVITFAQPEAGNLFNIGTQAIVPQHIWQNVSNPATYPDANPVGTGPYVLEKFSPQGILLKANPGYWNKSAIHVPAVDFPSYTSNTAAQQALTSGQIDWAGNFITNVQNVWLGADPVHNHAWTSQPPYMASNNVVTLWLNVTRGALRDPKVRQAISYAINRQQLSAQGESGYEAPATSSSGLMLPTDQEFLQPQYANDLPPTGDMNKVASILTSDGYTKVNGKWTKAGQTISFSIEDPIPYSDFWTDVNLVVAQLNAAGFDVKAHGLGVDTGWYADQASGNFDAMIRWCNQGTSPYAYYDNWMDYNTSAPIGKTAAGDFGRFDDPAAQAALAQYVSSSDSSVQAQAIAKLEQIESTQVPVVPLMYGASWAEFSTRNYTGWPSAANPYADAGPNPNEVEYVIEHLRPVS